MNHSPYAFSEAYASEMDAKDPLAHFRSRFHFPKVKEKDALYFCGNSLGLQPKTAAGYVDKELAAWATRGVDGYFHGEDPWYSVRKKSKPVLAQLLGALPLEVVAMNYLSVNLHLLMVSFYRPTPSRYKILVEAGAFPSDQYMLETQIKFHGLDPQEVLVELQPRPGEYTLRTEDILAEIKKQGSALALVNMAGIQYYTGQLFNIQAITQAAHEVGALAGFDLAHAAGNVLLHLHDWDVDFAAWCSYKYLNSGPGNVSGIFVHERFATRADLPRFAGWWGHKEEERFKMEKGFQPMIGADGWQLACSNVLSLAVHQASLDLFQEAGMPALRKKSEQLTGYLEYLIELLGGKSEILEIITPKNPEERGCQLSLLIHKGGKAVFEEWYSQGVVGDWRNPNVIRLAPAPLYTSFMDVFRFGQILEKSLEKFR
jgi:kynureninase